MSALTTALVDRVASGDLVVDEEISSGHTVVLTDGSGEQVAWVDRVKLAEALAEVAAEVAHPDFPTSWVVRQSARSVPLDRLYMGETGWVGLDEAVRFSSRVEATGAAGAGDAVTVVPLYGSEVL